MLMALNLNKDGEESWEPKRDAIKLCAVNCYQHASHHSAVKILNPQIEICNPQSWISFQVSEIRNLKCDILNPHTGIEICYLHFCIRNQQLWLFVHFSAIICNDHLNTSDLSCCNSFFGTFVHHQTALSGNDCLMMWWDCGLQMLKITVDWRVKTKRLDSMTGKSARFIAFKYGI